jgi:hypothetical protein
VVHEDPDLARGFLERQRLAVEFDLVAGGGPVAELREPAVQGQAACGDPVLDFAA